MTIIDARERFTPRPKLRRTTCHYCPAPVMFLYHPYVDTTQPKPWPQPFGACIPCGGRARADLKALSHRRLTSV